MRLSLRTALLCVGAIGAIVAAAATWYLGYVLAHPTYLSQTVVVHGRLINKRNHADHRTLALTVVAAVSIIGASYRPLYQVGGGRWIARRGRVRAAMRALP